MTLEAACGLALQIDGYGYDPAIYPYQSWRVLGIRRETTRDAYAIDALSPQRRAHVIHNAEEWRSAKGGEA